mmetsp:Transcript_30111/g.70050  ORF Transcript_30111/g.70050 Transcript_30111/m.70050 type:complete len:244 (-) Transcript_30111:3312-4043(-)
MLQEVFNGVHHIVNLAKVTLRNCQTGHRFPMQHERIRGQVSAAEHVLLKHIIFDFCPSQTVCQAPDEEALRGRIPQFLEQTLRKRATEAANKILTELRHLTPLVGQQVLARETVCSITVSLVLGLAHTQQAQSVEPLSGRQVIAMRLFRTVERTIGWELRSEFPRIVESRVAAQRPCKRGLELRIAHDACRTQGEDHGCSQSRLIMSSWPDALGLIVVVSLCSCHGCLTVPPVKHQFAVQRQC